ncbi:hypothetical protein KRP22_009383 [Phytophthora ramorum]|nr:hypothetical protein KRP22_8216 [Phytophthora ramorum]
MRLLYVAVVVVVSALASSDGAVATTNSTLGSHDARPWRHTDPNQDDSGGTPAKDDNVTVHNTPSSTGSSDEERAIKLSSSIKKLFKSKKIPSSITNLFKSNKNKMTPWKLRVKILESLPPELAANLIFLKMPTNVPKPLPSILPKGAKAAVFKIPGVENITIRLKMEVWFFYRYPPTYAFKELGLVGKGSGEALHGQANYKYFKSYFDAWYKSQKFLTF